MKYFLFLFFPFLMSSQTTKLIEKDFDQDGFPDTLESSYEGGSVLGGTYVTLTDGRTKSKFELNSFGCFCVFKKVVLIPQELILSKNKAFLEAIKTELLPNKANEADPSLQWLITAQFNHEFLPEHPIFDLVIESPPYWLTGEMQFPETYYIEIEGDKIEQLYESETELPEDIDFSSEMAWLIYTGHNHEIDSKEGFVLSASSDHFEIYKTAHGIIIKKEDIYSWLFVSDHRLTGSPEKLRWESIGEVKIVDEYIIFRMIHSRDFSNPIFIINSENGRVARLKTDDYIDKPFTIVNNKINITTYSGSNILDLEKLFDEFEKLF